MTDLQDLVLDKLVAATLGRDLPDSPLTVAAQLLEGKRPIKFGGKFNDSTMSEIARRLRWPVFLAEGVQGGIRALENEEDRRRFAMTLFRVLPVGGVAKRTNVATTRREAILLTERAHQVICNDPGCALARLLVECADDSKANPAVPLSPVVCSLSGQVMFNSPARRLTNNATPTPRMLYAVERAVSGFIHRDLLQAHDAIREATRVVAAVGGVAPAVEMLLHMARRCGLKVEMPS